MKASTRHHYCIEEECDYSEKNHKYMDGNKCPKCNGFIMSKKESDLNIRIEYNIKK